MELKFSKIDSFKTTELVRFDFKFKEGSDLLKRFLKWQWDNEVWSDRGGMSGLNQAVVFIFAKDAERVAEWLRQNGARDYGRRI